MLRKMFNFFKQCFGSYDRKTPPRASAKEKFAFFIAVWQCSSATTTSNELLVELDKSKGLGKLG